MGKMKEEWLKQKYKGGKGMKKKYRITEVSEILISKVILADSEDEALEQFNEEVDKDWGVISKVAEWRASEIIDIKEEKENG